MHETSFDSLLFACSERMSQQHRISQSVSSAAERASYTGVVLGSNPRRTNVSKEARSARLLASNSMHGYPSGQRGQSVKLLAHAYARFESCTVHLQAISSAVEHVPDKDAVPGSNPGWPIFVLLERWLSG